MTPSATRPRLLIEEWLPIAKIGIESLRERTPMTPFPAPNRLHVWWARRPLVASRAAVLASLLPADADRDRFTHILGIHGDPVASRIRIDEARAVGERFEGQAYDYKRAFTYLPSEAEFEWLKHESRRAGFDETGKVLDPTSGGGSIPFESARLGYTTYANELNPVAWLILKATIEFPIRHGDSVRARFEELAERFIVRRDARLQEFFPAEPEPNCVATNWIWARTITCPYCAGLVPLSPNWNLSSDGTGVRVHPQIESPRRCSFEIVKKLAEQSKGTVKGGDAECPFPDCGRVIDGDEIKRQAQAGGMGQQLYTVIFKREVVVGATKAGKKKVKKERGFRAPRPEDDVEEQVRAALEAKMLEWRARNIVPDEERYIGPADRSANYGILRFVDMFAPRQLYGHCASVEVFHDMIEELREKARGNIGELDKAAMTYLAIALDKMLNYNAYMVRWHSKREVVAGVFDRHDFAFLWSFAEMAPTITGVGYDWALKQTGKSLKELIELVGREDRSGEMFEAGSRAGEVQVIRGSADALDLAEASVDCIVMDPPYYDNVMYAELADFFYVWLKRTAGLLYPEAFADYLTDKDREAVANPAKFKGQDGSKKALAGRDYQKRMAGIFAECRRVLRPHGAMTVMFTHKASGAWDALAGGLIQAGFVITASWPVNTEAEGSLHIKEKSAAKSTIFLVCRAREDAAADADPVYWEDVEPKVVEAVRSRIAEFQEAGIGGVDLYLACFGPALQVFSEAWPLTRGRALQQKLGRQIEMFGEWDPYAVTPEDALLAARREVKRWRIEQLATVKRQHHLDPFTEWFILAWDAFKAPRFPADEALKLARVVGLDFDKEIKNVLCEIKGSDVILWDSATRRSKGKLGPISEEKMIDTLHHCANAARTMNTGAAKGILEGARLEGDPTVKTALEVLLRVLPPSTGTPKKDPVLVGAQADFVALANLAKLAFQGDVPAPLVVEQLELKPNRKGATADDDNAEEGEEGLDE